MAKDFSKIKIYIKPQIQECQRTRSRGGKANKIHLAISYSNYGENKQISKEETLQAATEDTLYAEK